jgi:hypothetical protein
MSGLILRKLEEKKEKVKEKGGWRHIEKSIL